MCKILFEKIKALFVKEKSVPLVDVDIKVSTNTKKIKKSKKLKNSIDNSVDNSTNIAGNQDNSTHENNFYMQPTSKDLIVSVRWSNLIPHKIEKVKNGIDCFNVLKPIDENHISPSLAIDFDDSNNNKNALYVLIKANSFIKNLVIKSIQFSLDTSSTSIVQQKNVFGILDKDRSFTLLDGSMKIGNGIIVLIFGFDYENRHYKQSFSFTVTDNSDEFVLKQYEEPELDINWSNFHF